MANAQTAVTATQGGLVVRAPTMDDPWAWLAAGWRDTWRNPLLSLGYGAAFVVIGLVFTLGFWFAGLESVVPAVAAGFALVGPILAIGLYEMSRRYERGEHVTFADVKAVRPAAPVQLAYLAFALMFVYLVWLRLATLNYALFTYGDYTPWAEFVRFALTTPAGLAMIVVGTAIGAALALTVFAISAVSAPILLRHDVDVFTAMAISVRLVLKHSGPMLLWAWLIAVMIAVGLATLFLGLVVVFPLLGHATWHAYRTVIAGEASTR